MLFLTKCTDEDIPRAAQMMCRVYAQKPWCEHWPLDRAVERVSGFLSGTFSKGWALVIETQPIGYLFGRKDIMHDGEVFYVEELFVHPDYQRKGSGSLALNQLAEILKKEGISRMELHTIPEDIPFYKKNGFTKSDYIYLDKKL